MSAKDSFVKQAMNVVGGVEKRLQAVGGQVKKNVMQGQANLTSGKAKYYGSINPLKGTLTALESGTTN